MDVSVPSAVSNGVLNAWVDVYGDGDFADPADHVLVDVPVVTGLITNAFSVPIDAVTGWTFARFRLSRASGLSYDGPARTGEVEDYYVEITSADGAPNPNLRMQQSGSSFSISWDDEPGSAVVLESAESLQGPWSPVPGATSPYTVVPGGAPQKFFRLRSGD